MNSQSCLAIIEAARSGMSANEKKLADFVVENASLIRDYSSQQIAAAVGVSQSSVVKFSQKLGYRGFTDLKLAVHESVLMQGNSLALVRNEVPGDDEPSVGDWLSTMKREALESCSLINEDKDIGSALRALADAGRVQVIGTGSASLVARDLASKLVSLGKHAVAETDAEIQAETAATLRRDDCLLILSASGQAAHIVSLAKQARKAGAVVISMTNQWVNPLAAVADIRLYSVSSDSQRDINQLIVAASQQHLADLLYVGLQQRRGLGSKAGLPKLGKGVR